MDGYWRNIALAQAKSAIAAAGTIPAAARQPELSLRELAGKEISASPIQLLAQSAGLGMDGPILALIEDQTGSGKTEAALLLAHRLMAAKRAAGLFMALPTMATANAMYGRLSGAYRRLFAPEARPSLVLAHGRRRDHDGFWSSILRDMADPDDERAGRTGPERPRRNVRPGLPTTGG